TRIITQPQTRQGQWLVDTVAELAQAANIGMPEVGIFPSRASNAFATDWNKNASVVPVSEGMLRRFGPNGIRPLKAHEIRYVPNGDMVNLALIQGVVHIFVMFFERIICKCLDPAVLKNEVYGSVIVYFIATIAAELVLGILASNIV